MQKSYDQMTKHELKNEINRLHVNYATGVRVLEAGRDEASKKVDSLTDDNDKLRTMIAEVRDAYRAQSTLVEQLTSTINHYARRDGGSRIQVSTWVREPAVIPSTSADTATAVRQ